MCFLLHVPHRNMIITFELQSAKMPYIPKRSLYVRKIIYD